MADTYEIMQKLYGKIIDLHLGINTEMARKLTKKALNILEDDLTDEQRIKETIKKVVLESELKPIEKQYFLYMKADMSEKEIYQKYPKEKLEELSK
ncbi:hypothetical protein C8C76_15912 [Halanaerobium saccharolyticum]|jgi:uncharacterized UPF0146 family protein|uniref:Uncharacterized protein n=1 Tax=Halanaerobium saccharolyticum TaxID=43595 RepID=A0A2T5RFA3_9FIRM|nr:hypothetical protein [Halanaerobium saccharolyticum]PTV92990.1 hypothetical protein C8C76_15912 [Halanaerobium saccharolyticum]